MSASLFFLATSVSSSKTVFNSRQTPTFSSSLSIANCLFESCSSTAMGGAIFASSAAYSFSISSCSFVNCSSTAASSLGYRTIVSGGAFAIAANWITLIRLCFVQCYGYQNGYVFFTTTSSSGTHQLNFSSAARCGTSSQGMGGIFMDYGAELLYYINSSALVSNNIYSVMIPGTYTPSCQILFTQIVGSTGQSILGIGYPCTYATIQFCNVISNYPTVAMFYTFATPCPVYNSVFANNSGSWIQFSYCTVVLYNCITDKGFSEVSISVSNCSTGVSNPNTVFLGSMEFCDEVTKAFTSANISSYIPLAFFAATSFVILSFI